MENPIVVRKFAQKAVMNNDLIEGIFDMTANQLKLFNNFVSLINKDDNDFKEYVIDRKVLTDIFGVNNPDNMYEVIGRAMDNLSNKVVKVIDRERRMRVDYPVFGRIEYKDGILKFKFNSDLKPFLLQLKQRFTMVLPKYLKPMQSKYSIRLYMLLSQFVHIGVREIDLKELREILGLNNKQYKLFYKFRVYVLDVAQKELEDTPMAFSFIAVTTGQGGKVVSIKFVLKHQAMLEKELERHQSEAETSETDQRAILQKELERHQPEPKNSEISQLIQLLPQEQRTQQAKEMLIAYLKKYDINYIEKQIEYTNKQKPNNYFGYLIKAIEKNYAGFDAQIAEEERIRRQKIFERKLQELEKERLHDIEVAVDNEKNSIYQEYVKNFDKEEKQEFLKKYAVFVKQAMPEIEETSFQMEFQSELFATKDIIAKEEIYQIRLVKTQDRAEKEAQKEFERKKKILEAELLNNDL